MALTFLSALDDGARGEDWVGPIVGCQTNVCNSTQDPVSWVKQVKHVEYNSRETRQRYPVHILRRVSNSPRSMRRADHYGEQNYSKRETDWEMRNGRERSVRGGPKLTLLLKPAFLWRRTPAPTNAGTISSISAATLVYRL